MKCQSLFPGKNKLINQMLSIEFLTHMLSKKKKKTTKKKKKQLMMISGLTNRQPMSTKMVYQLGFVMK